jgi:hypothetical protein
MWDYGMSLLADKPQSARIEEDFSRPDCKALSTESAAYNLEKSGAIAYLCLSESKDIKTEMNIVRYI